MYTKIITVALFAALLPACASLPPSNPPGRSTQVSQPQATAAVTLPEADAVAIALEHAGLTEADITRLRVHLDRDDRTLQWEVQWCVGEWEYDYDIHAETGAILDWDKDWDD